MALQVINTGQYNMDCRGDPLRVGFEKTNANFAILFAGTGLTPQVINVSTFNSGKGDTAYVAFSKINANFATLFAGFSNPAPVFVNVGTQAYPGVIGVADTGVLAWDKVNANFAAL